MSAAAGLAALVLAAGRGTRFGAAPKLLAELDGAPLVRHAVRAALAADLAPVLVVTGHRGDAVWDAAGAPGVRRLHNPAYADGLSTSLRAGFAALPEEVEGAFVLLADMPRVSPAAVRALAAAWRAAGRPPALLPTVGGRPGHPVLLSRVLAPDIARLTGDAGAAPLLRARTDVLRVPVDDEGLAADVDDPAALAALQARTTPSSTAP